MSWGRLTEEEWRKLFFAALDQQAFGCYDFVTGPGRSGAVASVYASHYLSIPYKPHKCGNYSNDTRVLIVDTVEYTGETLRKAAKWYAKKGLSTQVIFGVKEYKGHYFKMWYEK